MARRFVEQRAWLPARAEGLDALHAALDRFFAAAEGRGASLSGADRIAVRAAASEVAANIAQHACRHLPAARMSVALSAYGDRVEVAFEDSGLPYEEPGSQALEDLPQGGIGLRVVDASVDTVEYGRSGTTNRWRLVRRLPTRTP